MNRLTEGVLRFQMEIVGKHREQYAQLAEGQAPLALFIACSDSRVVPELITQSDPGDIFVVRNAGNIIPSYGQEAGGVSASIEYAVAALGIQNVVVCGHTGCGAMKAVLSGSPLEKMPAVASWIEHAAAAKEIVDATLPPEADESTRLRALIQENVLCQIRNLQTHPAVAVKIASGALRLYGWVYNIGDGSVDNYNAETGCFVPLTPGTDIHATPKPGLAYSRLRG